MSKTAQINFRPSDQALKNLDTIIDFSGVNQTAAIEMSIAEMATKLKQGENKMSTIVSVTRTPTNAFSGFRDVPESQDNIVTKQHACTSSGLKNAVKRVKSRLAEYSRTHGGGAVCGGWIETPFGKISIEFAEELCDSRYFKFENAKELKTAMTRCKKIVEEVNTELDEKYNN